MAADYAMPAASGKANAESYVDFILPWPDNHTAKPFTEHNWQHHG